MFDYLLVIMAYTVMVAREEVTELNTFCVRHLHHVIGIFEQYNDS